MKRYRVNPDASVDLKDLDPADAGDFKGGKENGLEVLLKLTREINVLPELLYAERKRKALIVLQAIDAGGKDGTIRRVFEGVNLQDVRVASFKVPTRVELDHEYS
jgi:polyphosphate kinase 2 (PPK2 family)